LDRQCLNIKKPVQETEYECRTEFTESCNTVYDTRQAARRKDVSETVFEQVEETRCEKNGGML